MSSIFNRIFGYRQREGRTPSEDYFTEVFVAVIERHDGLDRALAAWLSSNLDRSDFQSVRIRTQSKFTVEDGGRSRRPDIWIEAIDASHGCHWIIVENKIDSGEGENQLQDYAKILEEAQGLKSRTLVYITKYSSESGFRDDGTVNFKSLRWPKVYDFLQNELQNSTDGGELAVELLQLMEDWDMDGKLSAQHLRVALEFFNSSIGLKLFGLQNEAWDKSGLGKYISTRMNGKRWTKSEDRGAQSVNEIPGCGIALWMGFRFDRRDGDWDVKECELPSPAVSVKPYGENEELGKRLARPSEFWTGPDKDRVHDWINTWVRQPVPGNLPRFGEPLDEYYRNFFCEAFAELKQALESVK